MPANLTADQLRQWTRKEIEDWYSQEAFAEGNGLSAAYLSDFLNGKREAGEKMLNALGFEQVVRYRRKQA